MAIFKDAVLPTLTVITPVLVALATLWTDNKIGQVDEAVRAQSLEIARLEHGSRTLPGAVFTGLRRRMRGWTNRGMRLDRMVLDVLRWSC